MILPFFVVIFPLFVIVLCLFGHFLCFCGHIVSLFTLLYVLCLFMVILHLFLVMLCISVVVLGPFVVVLCLFMVVLCHFPSLSVTFCRALRICSWLIKSHHLQNCILEMKRHSLTVKTSCHSRFTPALPCTDVIVNTTAQLHKIL